MWGAILGAVSGASSLIGGFMGSRAAKKAAQLQADAAKAAGQRVQSATGTVNPQIMTAADEASAGVRTAADSASAGVRGAATHANEYLNPYIEGGGEAMTSLRDFVNRDEKFQFSEDDPSYQFRLQQGQQALERSAAARGSGMGGGTLKALTRYAQGAASTEYAAAFDRFRTTKNDRISTLSNLAGMGLTAGSKAGDNTMGAERYAGDAGMGAAEFDARAHIDATGRTTGNTLDAARYVGDTEMSAANVQAAGTIGSANAWSGGLRGAADGAMQGYTLSKLFGRGAKSGPANTLSQLIYPGRVAA